MKYISSVIIVFTVFALMFLIGYLVGAFICAEFDLSRWDKDVRGVIGFLFAIASSFASIFCVAEYWDNVKKEQS